MKIVFLTLQLLIALFSQETIEVKATSEELFWNFWK